MDLSVVIINFNTPDLLRDCLYSLEKIRQAKEVAFKVVVVNITPQDGSKKIIEEKFPWVVQIVDESNDGFSANNNKALPYIEGRYVLFLNSDTKVPLGTFKEIINYMDQNEDVAVVTPYVEIVSTGQFDADTVRRIPNPVSAFKYFFLKKPSDYQSEVGFDRPVDIEATAGAAMFVRKKAAEEVGWWDEDYFFYGEDLDWCYRFHLDDWRVVFYPRAKIYHYKGASSGLRKETAKVTRASKEQKKKMAKASAQAMRIFYDKNLAEKYPKPVNWLVRFGIGLLKNLRVIKAQV